MPRELTAAFIIAVYVPPSANVKDAMSKLYTVISELQLAHPDAFYLVGGDKFKIRPT